MSQIRKLRLETQCDLPKAHSHGLWLLMHESPSYGVQDLSHFVEEKEKLLDPVQVERSVPRTPNPLKAFTLTIPGLFSMPEWDQAVPPSGPFPLPGTHCVQSHLTICYHHPLSFLLASLSQH